MAGILLTRIPKTKSVQPGFCTRNFASQTLTLLGGANNGLPFFQGPDAKNVRATELSWIKRGLQHMNLRWVNN